MTTAVQKPPKLSFHEPSQQYLVRLKKPEGGTKYVYLGRNHAAAQVLYERLTATMPVVVRPSVVRPPTANAKTVTVAQAAAALVEYNVSQHPQRAEMTRKWSTLCLKPLVDRYGAQPVTFLETDHIETLQRDLALTLAPKTVNDYVGMSKRMCKYAAFKKWRSAMEFDFLRPMPKPAPKPKHYSIPELDAMLCAARDKKYRPGYEHKEGVIYAAIRLQLLCAGRPSEVVTLTSGDYEVVEPGAYMLGKSKTQFSSSYPRHLVLCKKAEELLPKCLGAWETPMAYLLAVKRATKRIPHNLRHSAAHAIHRMPHRASREQTDVFLGHYPPACSTTYNPIHWEEYVKIAERYAKHLRKVLPAHF